MPCTVPGVNEEERLRAYFESHAKVVTKSFEALYHQYLRMLFQVDLPGKLSRADQKHTKRAFKRQTLLEFEFIICIFKR